MNHEASSTSWIALLESRDRLIAELRYDVPALWATSIGRFLDEVRSVPRPLPSGVVVLLLVDLARELDRLAPSSPDSPRRQRLLDALDTDATAAHPVEALCRQFQDTLGHWCQRIDPGSLIPEVQAQRVANYIDQHFAEHITAVSLARLSGCCSRQLAREFRQTMKMSIRQYLQLVRIDHATARLRAGDKVESVVAAVGWRGRKNFFSQFKKRLGTTPAQYRECWTQLAADIVQRQRSQIRRLDDRLPHRARRDRTADQRASTNWTV